MAGLSTRALDLTTAPAVDPHPLYLDYRDEWQQLADVFDGSGGFRAGGYLIPHPREWEDHTTVVKDTVTGKVIRTEPNPSPSQPTPKLTARRRLARYENIAAPLVTAKRSALFKRPPTRTAVKGHAIGDWWGKVARDTSLDDALASAWLQAGIFGHVIVVLDRIQPIRARTLADVTPPILRVYTPLDIVDWIWDDEGELVALKLLEAVDRASFDEARPTNSYRVRILTRDGWRLQNHEGQTEAEGSHQLGVVPATYLYAQRRPLLPGIGQSVLHSSQLYLDLYNITSETRELLREQTFSMLNIVLGAEANYTVRQAIEDLGTQTGTGGVIFSRHPSDYIQADVNNVKVYQDERRELIRTIYRLAHVPWESDSRDAESADSMKLKRQEMHDSLADYATELQRTDRALSELWFRATYGAASWEREHEKAQIQITYPETFDLTPFSEIIEQANAALTLDMSEDVMLEIKQRLLPRFLPDLDEGRKDQLIASLKQKMAEQQEQQQMQKDLLQAKARDPFGEGGGDDKEEGGKAA